MQVRILSGVLPIKGVVMKVGDKVVMTKGPYRGRPGIITEVYGDKCTVVLTDTEGYKKGRAGVSINNVVTSDYK